VISVTILIPAYNEEKALPETLAALAVMAPPPDEILLVDGGSEDRTMEIALADGIKAVKAPRKGRAVQINHGVELAQGDVVCVLHADSILPGDAIAVIRSTMADQRIALASFMPRLAGPQGTRWGSTFHNWIKTWYVPLLARPLLFFKGVRLLYGDHAMFFRRQHFLAVGGCDERVAVMEEADLCIKFARFGRTKLVRRWVWTSDRRIVAWGRWRANWIYFKVGMMWALGARERLAEHYPDVR
jgi:glycosyltransferase involved in cell wall biosynthesis